jgi:hypothetical protein
VVEAEHADKPHREERNTDTEAHLLQIEEAAHDPVQEQVPRSAPAPSPVGTLASRAEGAQDTAGTPDTADNRDKATDTGTHTVDQAEHAGTLVRARASLLFLAVPSEAAFPKTNPSRHFAHSRAPASAFGGLYARESALVSRWSSWTRFVVGAATMEEERQGCLLDVRFPWNCYVSAQSPEGRVARRDRGIVPLPVKRPEHKDTVQGETRLAALWERDLAVRSWVRFVARRIRGGTACRLGVLIWACLPGCRLNYPRCLRKVAVRG